MDNILNIAQKELENFVRCKFILILAVITIMTSISGSVQGPKVIAIDAGMEYSIALTDDGNVWMWGDNMWGGEARGQLGNISIADNQCPLPVQSNTTSVKAVSTGYQVVSVLKNDGTVWSWGLTPAGQMGNGEKAEYDNMKYARTPIKANISDVKEISVGTCFTEALKNDGTVWQWGGRTGLRSILWSPVQVNGLSNIKNVKAGFNHAVALDDEGRVWTWGENITNSSDIHGYDLISAPVQVPISDVKTISAGNGFSLALKNDGTVWGVGDDTFGQLGDGVSFNGFTSSWSDISRQTPVMAQGLTDVIDIDSYDELSLALKTDGTVWEWGRMDSNKILTAPTQVPIDNVVAIACGDNHMLALKSDGSVWAWGSNNKGQLGVGTIEPSDTPVRVHMDDIQAAGSVMSDNVGVAGSLSHMISPALIALAGLAIIACCIAYYIKKNR